MQKRALAVQDISAIGRVSMMVALPILISAGIDTSCLPTALLSTHSGEFKDLSFLDLTTEMEKIIRHWQSIDLRFDAIQTGYLGSHEQVEAVGSAMTLAKPSALRIVDPVMGDHGKLYKGIAPEMVESMKTLCRSANILLPNLTEAEMLVGGSYRERGDDIGYVRDLLHRLHDRLEVPQIVLTGVSSKAGSYGAVCYDSRTGSIDYFEREKIDDHFYGTGDIFASVLTASLLNDKNLQESTDIAVDFTQRTIVMSKAEGAERRMGVCFEKNIPWLIQRLGLI